MTRRNAKMTATTLGVAAVLAISVAACGGENTATGGSPTGSGLPQGSEPVKLDPAEFTTKIDNPYWPMSPGSKWVYSETDTQGTRENAVVEVTNKTKTIANGIEARVIRDTVSENGTPVEITDDWYAQDSAGNIWYLGEYVTNYNDGKVVDHAGSFEAGVDGGQAGIALPANPKPGMSYRQEYYKGVAEDNGEVLSTEEMVQVPFGQFEEALLTKDTITIEPNVLEYKLYAKGIGPVLTLGVSGGPGSREELINLDTAIQKEIEEAGSAPLGSAR
jgi:hypothetical protein